MSERDPTIRCRKMRLKASNKAKGLVQIQVWVPESRRNDLYEVANGWRKENDRAIKWQRRAEAAKRNA